MKKISLLLLLVVLLLFVGVVGAQEVTATLEAPVAGADVISPELQRGLEPLILNLFELLLTALFGVLTAVAVRVFAFLKTRLSLQQLTFLKAMAGQAVLSAEQLGVSGQISSTAEAKKQYATNQLRERLAGAGLYHLANDTKLLSDTIEAGVRAHINSFGTLMASELADLDVSDEDDYPAPLSP